MKESPCYLLSDAIRPPSLSLSLSSRCLCISSSSSSSLGAAISFQINLSTARPSGVLIRSAATQSIMVLHISLLFWDHPSALQHFIPFFFPPPNISTKRHIGERYVHLEDIFFFFISSYYYFLETCSIQTN